MPLKNFSRKSKGLNPPTDQLPITIRDFPEIKMIDGNHVQLTETYTEEKVKRLAESDAREGIPQHDIEEISPIEKTMRAVFKGNCKSVIDLTNSCNEKIETEKKQYQAELDAIDETKDVPYFLKQLEAKKRRGIQLIINKYDGEFNNLEEDRLATIKLLNLAQFSKNSIIEKLGKIPVKRPIDNKVFAFSLLTILSGFEVPISFVALTNTAYFTGSGVLLLSAGIGICLTICSEMIGSSLHQKNYGKLAAAALSAIMVLVVITYLRPDTIILSLLNVAFITLGALLAYEVARYSEYFQIQASIKGYRSKLAAIERRQKSLRQNVLTEQEELELSIEAEAKGLANDRKEELKALIKHSDLLVVALENNKREQLNKIDSLYKISINGYRAINSKQRMTFEHEPVVYWEDNPPVSLLSEIDDDESNSPKSNPKKRFGGDGLSAAASLLLLITFSFLSMGCSRSDQPKADVLILIDKTISSNQNDRIQTDSVITDYIFSDIFMEDSNTCSAGSVTISSIGETSVQPTKRLSLPQGKPFLFEVQKEREQQIINFKQDVQAAIQKVRSKNDEQMNSKIYRNICALIPQLIDSDAEKKVLIIFSDLLENSSSLVSFYQYKQQPERIMKEYEKIVSTLEEDCPLGDLENIDIIIVHQSNFGTDELHVFAKRFFKKLFLSKGVDSITFLANL